MKKFFTLCICIVAVITTSAQEFTKVTEINGDTYPLYKKFNYNERPLMFYQKWISGEGDESVYEIAIYDYDFNLVKTLNIQGNLKDLEYENLDTPIPTQDVSFTQTLFNTFQLKIFQHLHLSTKRQQPFSTHKQKTSTVQVQSQRRNFNFFQM